MGRTLLGLAGLNLRSAMNDFFVRSQVLHETVILSLVKSAIHIYMVILFSLLNLAALSFYGPRIQLLYPWQLSTTTFAMCSENQGCNLCSTLKEPLAVPNSHKNISIINDIQKLQISDKPWHSRPQVSKSTSNTHYIGKSKAKLFFSSCLMMRIYSKKPGKCGREWLDCTSDPTTAVLNPVEPWSSSLEFPFFL